jgi:hypothetical protein
LRRAGSQRLSACSRMQQYASLFSAVAEGASPPVRLRIEDSGLRGAQRVNAS